MSERIILPISGEGGFSGDGPLPTFWSLMVGLRTVLSAVPFSLLICEACILRVKV